MSAVGMHRAMTHCARRCQRRRRPRCEVPLEQLDRSAAEALGQAVPRSRCRIQVRLRGRWRIGSLAQERVVSDRQVSDREADTCR